MRPSFHPRLINGPFGDPGLFVPLSLRKRALLFDLGDLSALSSGDILKTTHVFITHTHMDHFIGFDQLLRLLLGRGKDLHLFGPHGLLKNVRGKLQGYTWNLVQNYEEALTIQATEIDTRHHTTQTFRCQEGFAPTAPVRQPGALAMVLEEPQFTVEATILDHGIPSLAFAVKERFHINMLKPRMEALNLEVGPWVNHFKSLLYGNVAPGTPFEVPSSDAGSPPTVFTIGELTHQVTRITPGQKFAYVTDAFFSPDNREKIVALSHEADHLFIEATFLEEDKGVAKRKGHLTAHQAGTLARSAHVREMTVFHHSARYSDQAHLLRDEAQRAFMGL